MTCCYLWSDYREKDALGGCLCLETVETDLVGVVCAPMGGEGNNPVGARRVTNGFFPVVITSFY
jgi:hypothetical protein